MGVFDFIKRMMKQNNKSYESFTNVPVTVNIKSKVSVTSQDIDPVMKKKLDCGLLPGEVILINWINGKVEPLNFPKYFHFQYGIDANQRYKSLIIGGYISSGDYSVSLNKLKVAELKEKLNKKELPVSGKKAELVERLSSNLTELETNKLPKSYILSKIGHEIINEYDYIVKAHSDRHFSVSDAILYKNKNPQIKNYSNLKWSYLNSKLNEYQRAETYGLLRNVYFARAEQLHQEDKPIDALANLLTVQIIDCTGLSNGPSKPYYENIMFAPGIFDRLVKYNSLVTEEEYEECFDRALNFLKSMKSKGFVTTADLQFLKKELRKPNEKSLVKYFSKYKKYSYNNQ